MKMFTLAASAAILSRASVAEAQETLTMWYHGAGNEVESKIINRIITDFNASQADWKVELQSFPQAAYNDSVVAGALAGNLPDILDVDVPVMPNWAWAGYMQPLQIDETLIAEFLPGPKGYWDGKLYSIGLWDAAVALVTRQAYLDELGLSTPTLEQPWTGEEFMAALDAAKASGKFEYAFDPGMASTGEWYPYAFSPFLQSFGGDIVDRTTCMTAEGALNCEAGLKFGDWQGLFKNGYAPATQDPADRDGGFELLQPLHLGRQQTGILLLPVEIGRLADPRLAADLRNRPPVFALLDDERLLRVRENARLHPIPLLSQPEKRSGKLQLQTVQFAGIRSVGHTAQRGGAEADGKHFKVGAAKEGSRHFSDARKRSRRGSGGFVSRYPHVRVFIPLDRRLARVVRTAATMITAPVEACT